MPKKVTFQGRVYNFPDEATDEQVFEFLQSEAQANAPVVPPALPLPEAVTPTPTFEPPVPEREAIAAERDNNRVFLRADGSIPYERVVQVMGALNAGGFNNIGLVTETGGPAFGAQPVR